MTNPAVSILMPTYNGAAYLDAQIASILAQDFGDFELVIVDDGSCDNTPAVLARHAGTDPRIRVLPATGNRGQKARLSELHETARADLLAFSDQDDIWDRHKLGRLVRAKGDHAAAFGTSEIIDGSGTAQGVTLLEMLPPPLPGADDHLIYLFKPMISAHSLLIDADTFDPTALCRTHPFDWLISLDAVFSRGVVYVPDAVTFHRIHQTNQSNGRLGRKPTLAERYAPSALRRRFGVRTTERWMLVQRLEHLSHSLVIDPALRQIFRKAHDACVRTWFDQDRRFELLNRKLLVDLSALLLPLAQSAIEREYADKWLRRLVRSAVHPFNIAWQVGSFLRARTMPRPSS